MNDATTLSPEVVHEAVDERQFVRTKIPARVTLHAPDGDVACEIRDISLGGIGLHCEHPLAVGALYPVSIELGLSAASLSLEARIRIVSQDGPQLGAEFVEMDPQKRDILRYLIASYLSGEMANINGLFNVMQRENYIKQRKKIANTARTLAERLQALFGSLVYFSLGLLVLGLLLYKAYLFFFQVSAAQAVVSADAYVVSMPENGELKFLVGNDVQKVSTGQPLASVSTQLLTNFNTPSDLQALASMSESDLRTLLGRALIETVIASPCDCYLYYPGRTRGGYAYKTDTILHLIPQDRPLLVKASFPFDKLKDVERVRRIDLRVAGIPEPIAGSVANYSLDSLNQMLVLDILPQAPLPLSSYQKPVAVDVYLGLPFATGI
ncbi:Mannuronan synthase [compost metagenome]